MKKTLLLLVFGTINFISAQVLQSGDFNALTVGNVGTVIDGTIAGQGDWLTFSTNGAAPTTGTNAGNSNFQVVANGFGGTNGVKIIGSDGNAGTRFLWKDGLPTAWNSRNTGNNIINVEYDLYTGATTTSTSLAQVVIFGNDSGTNRVLNGLTYTMDTRVLSGLAYINNGGTYGLYNIPLQQGGLVLDSDTWYRVGFAYDTTTGEVIWKTSTIYSGLPNSYWTGPFQPDEIDFLTSTPNTNVLVSEIIYDNYSARATATEDLLNTKSFNTSSANISIYPNPVNDVVNISSPDFEIQTISITDINGRVVKNIKVNNTTTNINVSDLNSGVYFMSVNTLDGNIIKKFVKN